MNRIWRTMLIATIAISWQGTSRLCALEPGQKLDVEFFGVSTHYFKGRHGLTEDSSGSGAGLAEGKTGRSYLAYGSVDEKHGFALHDLCTNACGSMKESDDPIGKRDEILATQKPAHYWNAEYRVLPSDIGKIALDVTWEHWSTVGTGRAVMVGGDTRHIEMREGERHVLDFVQFSPPGDDYCYSNVQVAVTAKVMEDPALQNESLGYDVWFEHLDPHGVAIRRRFQGLGKQGEETSFRMEPIRTPVPGGTFDDGAPADSVLEVSGTIRGRVLGDGSIAIELRAGRWLGAARPGQPRLGGTGDGGNKVLTMKPGETTRMTLPKPQGGTVIRGAIGEHEQPLTPDTFVLRNASFYAGSQDSIILTVNRVH